MKSNSTLFTLSMNKLLIGALVFLLIGGVAGYGLEKVQGQFLRSSAMAGCNSAGHDVDIYLDHLIGILQGGGRITLLQLNTFIDLVEIRDECRANQFLA